MLTVGLMSDAPADEHSEDNVTVSGGASQFHQYLVLKFLVLVC